MGTVVLQYSHYSSDTARRRWTGRVGGAQAGAGRRWARAGELGAGRAWGARAGAAGSWAAGARAQRTRGRRRAGSRGR